MILCTVNQEKSVCVRPVMNRPAVKIRWHRVEVKTQPTEHASCLDDSETSLSLFAVCPVWASVETWRSNMADSLRGYQRLIIN